jgi:lysophospholipase L1-like esterase
VALGVAGLRETLALAYYESRGWLTPAAEVPAAQAFAQGNVVMGTQWERRHPDGPLVILGASYAQGWNPGEIAGAPVVNIAVTGQQSFEMLERFERDVVPLRPRIVILWGFINDIFRAPPGQLEASLERVLASYRGMFELARRHGIEPILATEITVRPPDSLREWLASWVNWLRGKESYQDGVNRAVLATNRSLSELARQEGVLVLDFQSALGEPNGWRAARFVQPDGSHVTDAGYTVLTDYARPLLEKHVVRR